MKAAILAAGAGLTLALAALAACETTPPPSGDGMAAMRPVDRCVRTPLEDTRVVDQTTLVATDYSGAAVLIKMTGPCLEPNEPIVIEYHGSNQICDRMDVDISGRAASAIPTVCFIDSVTPISKADAQGYLGRR
jgi:hypothetical protein